MSRVHTFLPLPPRHLRAPPPAYHQPVLVSTYSHLPDRSIEHSDAAMSYYRPAPRGADLTYGLGRLVERDETVDEHLDGLCEGLMRAHQRGMPAERPGGIITWRGMITRIMTAPWEEREGWEMTALALDGSVYIELNDPPELRAKRRNDQSAWAVQSYMGYAFESFSTVAAEPEERRADDPEGWSGDVNTNVQVGFGSGRAVGPTSLTAKWCNIVRSSIGEIPLCLGGEVDCVRAQPGDPHPGLDACVELKTNKTIENEKQDAVFHKKLLKHWAQSYLLGVGHVEVGFRSGEGVLESQHHFATCAIPHLVEQSATRPWHPAPSLHFLHSMLALVARHVLPTDPAPAGGLGDDAPLPPAVVWRFVFAPRRGCELYHDGPHTGNSGTAGRWGGVLPEDYVRWRMRRKRAREPLAPA